MERARHRHYLLGGCAALPKQLSGAEIFAVGTWNGRTFSEADLDTIVSAFNTLGLSGRVPLKLGHDGDDSRDGAPALGWVSRVWREGKKLLADFTDVPSLVYDAIKNGLYKFVSIELLRDVPADTRSIPWVLDAVALLGADQPAVGILRDLQALTLTRGTGLRCAEHVIFARHTATLESATFKETPRMSDKNQQQSPSNAELLDKITDLTNQNSELREQFSATKAELAESQRYRRQFEEMQEKHATERRESHRTAIKDRFERAVKSKSILPAVRERFYKRFDVLEGKDIERISLADVDEYIAENPNPTAPRTHTAHTLVGSFTDDERAMIGALPDKQLFIRSMKRVRELGLDPQNWQHLFRASQDVLRGDESLAESYRMLPDHLAAGHYE